MRGMLALSGTAAAFLAGLAIAPAAADDRATCMSKPTTGSSVPACTRVIESGGKDLHTVYVWRCYHFRQNNDYDRSLEDANAAIRLERLSASAFLCRAETLVRKRDYDGAIRDATEVISLDAANEEGYFVRGYSHFQKGDDDKAIADMAEAIRLRPEDARPHIFRARSYIRQEQFATALVDLDDAIRLDPRRADAYDVRAQVYSGLGDDEKAIVDATEAIRLSPQNGRLYSQRGFFYRQADDFDRAISDLNKATALDPAFAPAYSNRGEIHRQKGELDRAVIELTKALLLDPTVTAAFTRRGLAFERGGDVARARADYNEALARPPGKFTGTTWAIYIARQRLAAMSGTRAEPGTVSSPAPARIGGLAVGTCDHVGSTTGLDNVDEARWRTLSACGWDKTCRIVVPISGNCAAFAVGSSCSARGWAAGADRGQASAAALSACRESGGRDCKIRLAVCDGEG